MTSLDDCIKSGDYKMSGTISHLFAGVAGKKMTTERLREVPNGNRSGYSLVALERKEGTWDVFKQDVLEKWFQTGVHEDPVIHSVTKKSTLQHHSISRDKVAALFEEHEKKCREFNTTEAQLRQAAKEKKKLQSLAS